MREKEGLLPNTFWEDDKWAHEHYQELSKRYPNRWIAVADKKVISFGEDLGKVEKEANKKIKKKDFPIMFIERGAHVYKD